MTNQHQTPQLAEALSSLMDNQASELELQRLLKATQEDAELMGVWSRYHLISAKLKNEAVSLVPSDFASKVSAAISLDEQQIEPTKTSVRRQGGALAIESVNQLWSGLGRVAVAASVALAVVVGVRHFQQPSAGLQQADLLAANQVVVPSAQPEVNLPSGINAPAISARTVAVQSGFESSPQNRRVVFVPRQSAQVVNPDEISAYVNDLMEVHSDNAARNSGQGVLPFTRVILTEDE